MEKDYYGWGLPVDISTHGATGDQLIYFFHGLMAILFFGWLTYIVIALVRYRARKGHQATYKLNHFKAPTYIEIIVAIIEAVLLFGFSVPMFHQYRNVHPSEGEALNVRVVAEQFAWNVHYPGPDGVFGKTAPQFIDTPNPLGLDPNDPNGSDDINSINQLRIPVNTPVRVKLSSKDVIHSFAIPVMRVKQDIIPGKETLVSFEATQTGKFEIACAQLCGLGHYRMRGFFTVDTAADFSTWLKDKST
jgi:cytochrome c oxidase subunit II